MRASRLSKASKSPALCSVSGVNTGQGVGAGDKHWVE